MKNAILFLFGLFITYSVTGQITGTKSIPGHYATIQAAITALNSSGTAAPGVTFNVASGHTETGVNIVLNTSTSSSSAPIVFQRAPGATVNPKITVTAGSSSLVDAGIKIAGSDYVTFDAIDINASAQTTIEWGYALVKKSSSAPFNGCQHVTIRNCVITMNKTNLNSVGLHAGNHTAYSTTSLSITSATDAHNACKFYSNTITNVALGIDFRGYAASSPYTLYDQNNEIGVDGGNIITDYASTAETYGLYAIYQNGIKIANNQITSSTTGNTSTLYGICLSTGTNSNAEIFHNNITVHGKGTTTTLYGINNGMGSSGTNNSISIHHNIVENCTYTTATSGSFYGIYHSGGCVTFNCLDNQVRNNTIGSASATATGMWTGIYFTGSNSVTGSTWDFSGNEIFGNQRTQSVLGAGIFFGFYCSSFSVPIINVHENAIHDNVFPSTTSAIGMIYLNLTSTNTSNIYQNEIYSHTGGGTVYGIFISAGTYSNIFKNNVYDLTSAPADGSVNGLYVFSGTNINLSNNVISDLKAPTATGVNAVVGINLSPSNFPSVNVDFNTVYLNANSSSVTTFGSSALYTTTSHPVTLRNNILINTSTPVTASPAYTVVYRRSSTALGNYQSASNNNCFYAGVPGPNNLIYFDGTNADITLPGYQARVAPRDNLSVTENVAFVDVINHDFHIDPAIVTQCESGGKIVSGTYAVNDDFDGDARFPNPGYPLNPSYPPKAPDIGADEFGGIPLDNKPPVITYTPLNKTFSTLPRTLTATITDELSEVPASLPGLPVLYWKINTGGSWNAATASYIGDSTYEFTFGDGVVTGDVVYYYIVARDDNAPTANVIASPSSGASGYSYDPPACAVPPVILNSYSIAGYVSGSYTIDNTIPTGGTNFNSFTDAIHFLNYNVPVSPGLTFDVTSGQAFPELPPPITESGSLTTPIVFQKYGSSANPIIQPTGTTANHEAGIALTGGDYFTFDGIDIIASGNAMEYGYYLRNLDATNGASHNTIKNARIVLDRSNTASRGIMQSASPIDGGGFIPTSAEGANSFNEYFNLTIENSFGGIWLKNDMNYTMGNYYDLDCKIHHSTIGAATPNDIGGGAGWIAGIVCHCTSNIKVYNNVIRNIKCTSSTLYGIYIRDFSLSECSNNMVYEISSVNTSTSGSGIVRGIYVIADRSKLFNNVIYNIKHGCTSASSNTLAIGLDVYGSSEVYFNAVRMANTQYPSSAALSIYGGANDTLKLKNNIFSNFSTPGTGSYRYCIRLEGFSKKETGNNLLFINTSGTNNYVGWNDYTYQKSLEQWAASLTPYPPDDGVEFQSANADPNFTSSTDLTFAGSTPAALSGVAIAGYDTDILGNPRDISRPTIGAYETIQPQNDKSAPKISNIVITSAPSTTVSCDLLDNSNSVNNATVRLWYRIAGSGSAFTGIDADIKPAGSMNGTYNWNISLPVIPQTYEFYITARDDQGAGAGIWANPMWTTAISATTPWAAADPPDFYNNPASYANIRTFSITTALPGGVIPVGTGETFSSLTNPGGIFEVLNYAELQGNITINITSDLLAETGTHGLSQWVSNGGPWSVTVQSSGGPRVIEGNRTGTGSGLIRLDGCDNLLVDGGAGRELTFRNATSTPATTAPAFLISSGANNVIIQNSIIECNVSATDIGAVMFGNTGVNENNTLANNWIRDSRGTYTGKPYVGIYFGAGMHTNTSICDNRIYLTSSLGIASRSSNMVNPNISDNTIFDFGAIGIFIYRATAPVIIGNELYSTMAGTTDCRGIDIREFGNGVNGLVMNNYIHDLKGSATQDLIGIELWGMESMNSNLHIANNVIALETGGASSTSGSVTGILYSGNNLDSVSIYYNSIFIGGTGATGSYSSYGVRKSGAATQFILKNNSVVNVRSNGSGTGTHFGIAISNISNAFSLNNNNYYVNGSGTMFGYWNTGNVTTLSEWQTITGNDLNSISADPLYTSSVNLLPLSGSPLIGAATPLAGIVDDDIIGTLRSTTFPTIGAYEVNPDRLLNLSLFLEGLWNGVNMNEAQDEYGPHWGAGVADQITVELHEQTSPFGLVWSKPDVSLNTAGNAAVTVPFIHSGTYYLAVKHRNSIETWSGLPIPFTSSPITYNFSDNPVKAFGNNLIALTPGIYGIYGGDENQDMIVDTNDLGDADNDSQNFVTGYVPTDVNGDGIIDTNDLGLIDNNSNGFVGAVLP